MVKICAEVLREFPGYYPVGDICNDLFYVQPPAGVNMPPHLEKEILRYISAVNQGVLNVHSDELIHVPAIMMVAGTKKKALAIRQLLLSKSYQIKYLCTDAGTAEELLK